MLENPLSLNGLNGIKLTGVPKASWTAVNTFNILWIVLTKNLEDVLADLSGYVLKVVISK